MPPALVAYVAISVASSVWRRSVLPASLGLSPYAIVLAMATAATAPSLDDRSAAPLLPVAFAAMHLGWGLGFWEGLMHELKAGKA